MVNFQDRVSKAFGCDSWKSEFGDGMLALRGIMGNPKIDNQK